MSPLVVAAVLVAGAAGAVIRYALSRALPVTSARLPLGILIVNLAGSALAGAVIGLAERFGADADLRLILVTGFCGGLTTFSTWSVETIELVTGGRPRAAVWNLVLTLVGGLIACAALYLLCR